MRPQLLSTAVENTVNQRSTSYGDPFKSFGHLARIWTELIENHYNTKLDHPLPPRVASLMMVAVKMLRASTTAHADSHVDLAAFNQFAADFAHHELDHQVDEQLRENFDRIMKGSAMVNSTAGL